MPTALHRYTYRRKRRKHKSDYTGDASVKWFIALLVAIAIYIIIQTLTSREISPASSPQEPPKQQNTIVTP